MSERTQAEFGELLRRIEANRQRRWRRGAVRWVLVATVVTWLGWLLSKIPVWLR